METRTELRKEMQRLAKRFLNIADKLNEKVSNYLDGSDSYVDYKAYTEVKNAEADFLAIYNQIYEEGIKPALNYEIAESVLDGYEEENNTPEANTCTDKNDSSDIDYTDPKAINQAVLEKLYVIGQEVFDKYVHVNKEGSYTALHLHNEKNAMGEPIRVSFSENPEYTVQVGPFRCKFPASFVFKLINRFEKLNNMGNKKMKVFTYGENPAEIVSAPCVYLDAEKEFKTGKKKIKKITDSLALLRMAGGRFRVMYHISGTWYQIYDCINGGSDFAEKRVNEFSALLSDDPERFQGMIFSYECTGGAYDQIIVAMRAAYGHSETSQNLNTKEEEVKPVVEHYFVKKKTDLEQLIESGDLDSINEMIKQKEEALNNAIENVNYYKEINNIEFMENEEVRAGRLQRDLELLRASIKKTSNTKNMDSPAYGDSETSQTLEQEEQEEENRIRERFPLEGITVEEDTAGPNGVVYFTVEGAGPVTGARVRADLNPGDTFNVCTKDDRRYVVTYDGVSLNRSIWNELPDIVEYEEKYYPEDCPTDADGNRFYTDTREDYAPFPYVVVDRLDGSVWFFTDSEDEAKEWATDYNREYCEGGIRKTQPGATYEVTRADRSKCAG